MPNKFERFDNKFNRIASNDDSNDFYFEGYTGPRITEAAFGLGNLFKGFKHIEKVPATIPQIAKTNSLSEISKINEQNLAKQLNDIPGIEGARLRNKFLSYTNGGQALNLDAFLELSKEASALEKGGKASFVKNLTIGALQWLKGDKSQSANAYKNTFVKVKIPSTKNVKEMTIGVFLENGEGAKLTDEGIINYNKALNNLMNDVKDGAASKRTLSNVVLLTRLAVLGPALYLPYEGLKSFVNQENPQGTDSQFKQMEQIMNSSEVTYPSSTSSPSSYGGVTNQGNFGNLGDYGNDTSNLPIGASTTDPSVIRGSNENSIQRFAEDQMTLDQNIPQSMEDLFDNGLMPIMEEYGQNNPEGLKIALDDYLNSIINNSNQVLNYLEQENQIQENQSGANNDSY